jgi:hypothetical protein
MTWIGLSLLATAAFAIEEGRARRAGLIALAAAGLLLAHATKETSLVLVPISVGWLAIELWSSRARETGTRFAAVYVVINLVAKAIFVALRWSYAPLELGEGTYTRVPFGQSMAPASISLQKVIESCRVEQSVVAGA